MYGKITPQIISYLINISGKDHVFTDSENIDKYSQDETEDLSFLPEVVVKPASANEISEILKLANHNLIPVYTRGGGTGLSGGALPVHGGIVLSMERFNKILEIDEYNFQAVVEAGVITQVFQEELEKIGLFYPVDPASRGSCFIGGNVAECSGGPRAAKYGVTRNYILGLEFVTPKGEIIFTGSRTLKNVTGYSLAQLLCGSEGTLGIVTKIVFRVLALPKYKKILLIAYKSVRECISSVSEIYHSGVNPSALEFLTKDAIKAAENQLGKSFPNSDSEAQLLIELDGNNENVIDCDIQTISDTVEKYNAVDIILAEERAKMEELWALRRSVGEAVKSISTYKEEDTVVPRAKLPELLDGIMKVSAKYNIKIISYGHAGDGNLHVNILKENLTDEYWNTNVKSAIKEIFEHTVSLGGTISGEHGIGYTQKEFLPIALSKEEIELSKNIKKTFDPNNILNPGKIFSD
ncbi:MAG: FAD-linked oxidase C-terminal domain-containing protein [Candidatus Kapaibacterium sp.]